MCVCSTSAGAVPCRPFVTVEHFRRPGLPEADDEPALLYIAQLGSTPVPIKFARRYGGAVHKAWADAGCAVDLKKAWLNHLQVRWPEGMTDGAPMLQAHDVELLGKGVEQHHRQPRALGDIHWDENGRPVSHAVT